MRKHVGLKNVAHNEMALALAKSGKKCDNEKLKPVAMDMKGKPIKPFTPVQLV
jgi:hypothetical protein